MPRVTLGGDRLGSGAGMQIDTKTFNRSTHDLSFRLKTTASAGTLIPFLSKILLPGSSHNINLNCDILTGPTVGPLFGSFKVQLDVFTVPIRLYQPQLHNDKLNIGKDMAQVRFPLLRVAVPNPRPQDGDELDNFQINPSHTLSYLDYRGMGYSSFPNVAIVTRDVNGLPILGLADIYKNYYANKQEGKGAYIHQILITDDVKITENSFFQGVYNEETEAVNVQLLEFVADNPVQSILFFMDHSAMLNITIEGWEEGEDFDFDRISVILRKQLGSPEEYKITELFEEQNFEYIELPEPQEPFWALSNTKPTTLMRELAKEGVYTWGYKFNKDNLEKLSPRVQMFDLKEIDDRREDILSKVKDTSHYIINDPTAPINAVPNWYTNPYNYIKDSDQRIKSSNLNATQEGLFLKTYQNDILQSWLNIGVGQIDTITAVKVHEDEEGNGTIILNELNLSKKLYNMLNDVEASGGSYRDYIKVVYNTEMAKITMSPVYVGGLSKELIFQQIISNSASADQPLGTLAGRGALTDKHKGGKIRLNVDEPSYIIGLFSLTPRLDYSQGNTFQMDVKTMTDLHNPYFDQIGFQNLPVEWMNWVGTSIEGAYPATALTKKVIGKQPAYVHWQTDVNKTRGNFADKGEQAFMVINRGWETRWTTDDSDPLNPVTVLGVKDLTTYVDPVKSNYIFAVTDITAQNFWVQIDVDHEARMVMSAQPMPRI